MDAESKRTVSLKRSEPVNKNSRASIRTRNYPYATEYTNCPDCEEITFNGGHVTNIHLGVQPGNGLASAVSTTPITDLTAQRRRWQSERSVPTQAPPPPSAPPPPPPPPPAFVGSKTNSVPQKMGVETSPPTVGEEASENAWPGTRLGGKADGLTSGLRSYWQQNVLRDEREKAEADRMTKPKTFGFPKWRSTDALSASLVASNPVKIPHDSRIPEQRIQKMRETEQLAQYAKEQIHRSVEQPPRLNKGKSLESLVVLQQAEQQPWYDREKIREAISRESIANISVARQRFEMGEFPRQRFASGHSTQSQRESLPPPPLPPKSEEVQQIQRTNAGWNGNEYQNGRGSPYSSQYTPSVAESITYAGVNGYYKEPTPTSAHSYEQQLLLLYLRQNPQVLDGLGVVMTETARQAAEDLPWRRVELRVVEDDNVSYQSQQHSPSRQGRYLKKAQQNSVQQRYRPNARNEQAQPDPERRPERLIAAEIRLAQQREEELRRSRSELGLASLEDTIDLWRSGQPSFTSPRGMRSATSYDQLHHHQQQQQQQENGQYAVRTSSTNDLVAETAQNGLYRHQNETMQNPLRKQRLI